MNRIAEECVLCDFGIYSDFFLQALTKRIGSYIKVVLRLQANPEPGGHSEKSDSHFLREIGYAGLIKIHAG